MLKRTVIGLAVAGLAMTYAPAFADAPETNGLICQFASVVDPTAENGTQSGQISGGPVVLTEQSADPNLPGTVPESGTLTCRVQVNVGDHTGSGPFISAQGTGVFTAGPTTITYVATDTDKVYLCSEFTDDSDGLTYYWDDDNSEWSTSAAVPCGIAVGGTGDPSDDPINRIPCPLFAQLPSPVAEALQAAWGDCANSGPNSVAAVAGVGATGVFVAPPLWSCTKATGSVVGPVGSVTCSPPGLNSLTGCKEVFNTAVTVPDPDLFVNGGTPTGSITGTTACGSLTVDATANNDGIPIISLQSEVGNGSMPITCSWNASGTLTAWAVLCSWNLGL